MERETRFELATLALARRCSTTELLPLGAISSIPVRPKAGQTAPARQFPPAPIGIRLKGTGFSPYIDQVNN